MFSGGWLTASVAIRSARTTRRSGHSPLFPVDLDCPLDQGREPHSARRRASHAQPLFAISRGSGRDDAGTRSADRMPSAIAPPSGLTRA
jgi:hypothetical protein